MANSFFLQIFFRILNFPNDVFLFICYCFQKAVISIACLFDKMVQKPQSLSFVFNHAIVTNDRDIGFFEALLTSPFGNPHKSLQCSGGTRFTPAIPRFA